MSAEKETVIATLRREMKESPLSAPAASQPSHRVYADGYERQTAEEPLVMTRKYRHRALLTALRLLLIVLAIGFITFAIFKTGIIRVRF